MKPIENFLRKVAVFQHKHASVLFMLILVITAFMLVGFTRIEVQSDLSESNPKDIEIYKLNDKVTETFGGQDLILVLFTLDDKYDFKDMPKDIRDKSIIKYILELENSLRLESSVSSVASVGSYFQSAPLTQEEVDNVFRESPAAGQFFSKNFESTFLMVRSDTGTGKKKVSEINNLINEKLNSFSQPPGTKIWITGTPPIQVTISELLIQDAVFTIILALILIFGLINLVERNIVKSIMIFLPLILGLIWTIGSLGWLNIKISMITAGLGAMILGLGVEYGVFMLTRYEEERKKGKNQLESLKVSVPGVGSAIIGSGMTTVIGFLSLTLSILPMLRDLGASLALGIGFTLIAAVFVAPVLFLNLEKIVENLDSKIIQFLKTKVEAKI
jgi:uncharacterized protein